VAGGFGAGLAITSFKPDCLLVDLTAAHVDGLALVQEIRAHPDSQALTVIACAKDEKLLRKAVSSGFDQAIGKPVDIEELKRLVEVTLRTRSAA